MLTLDHAVFPVRNAAATMRFYREFLGLPLVAAHSGDDWGGYAWLMMIFGLSGKQEIVCVALKGAPAADYGRLPKDVRHYAFAAGSATELEAWREKLAGSGLDWWEESHGDDASLYFPDPDGVILEITWPPSRVAAVEDAAAVEAATAWMA